jgi:ribonuclease BN (tRNA processing enzyme)
MLDVCLLGTGGMMPLPNRWLTSLMLRYNGSGLLIDCGEGTQVTIRQKGWSVHGLDVICFTHYHGDHILGIPGLLQSMNFRGRETKLTIYGPKGLDNLQQAIANLGFPNFDFPLEWIEIDSGTIIENDEDEDFKDVGNDYFYENFTEILYLGDEEEELPEPLYAKFLGRGNVENTCNLLLADGRFLSNVSVTRIEETENTRFAHI